MHIRLFTLTIFGLLLGGCAGRPPKTPKIPHARMEKIHLDEYLHDSGDTRVALGGLSGVFFSEKESSENQWILYSLTDRGPNEDPKDFNGDGIKERPFLAPDFQPQILKIRYDLKSRRADVIERIGMNRPDGSKLTGRPNVDRKKIQSGFDEVPVSVDGHPLPYDPWGVDSEDVLRDDDGHFWVCEEYGPSLIKLSSKGRALGRWYPAPPSPRGGRPDLPAVLAQRPENRGFEALALSRHGTLYVFLQSPIAKWTPSHRVPVLEFDPKSGKTVGLFLYPSHEHGGKIGGAVRMRDGRIAVLEQNGRVGEKAWQRLFAADFSKADNLLKDSNHADGRPSPDAKPAAVEDLLDLSPRGLHVFEKLEGLALAPDGRWILVNDNDFGMNGKKEDSWLILTEGKQ